MLSDLSQNETFERWASIAMTNGLHRIAHAHPERIRSGFYRWRKRTGIGRRIQVRVEPGLLILIRMPKKKGKVK
jgi:hypothetical protein